MKRLLAILPLAASALLSSTEAANAIPAITCHCFTDRSYDPAKPAAADPYFLATTANTFLAVAFNIDKKSIVMKKQAGTSSDDLWIAGLAAAKSGIGLDTLLQAKKEKESWQKALAVSGVNQKSLPPRFTAQLGAGAAAPALAQAVVDDLIVQYRIMSDADVAAIRKNWTTNQEIILAALIATKTKQPARQLLAEVKSGAKTWGRLLQDARIEPKDIQREVTILLKAAPR